MGQKVSDTVSGSGGDAGKEGQSMMDKAKDTLGLSKKHFSIHSTDVVADINAPDK